MTFLAALLAATIELHADPPHTTASFAVKHMVVTTVRGQFGKTESTLLWDKQDPTKSSVDFKIDVSTIDTREAKRDGHLKSPDFFDAARCPEMTFKSSKIEPAGGDKFKVSGDLTMHFGTKPGTLGVIFNSNRIKSPLGTTLHSATADRDP